MNFSPRRPDLREQVIAAVKSNRAISKGQCGIKAGVIAQQLKRKKAEVNKILYSDRRVRRSDTGAYWSYVGDYTEQYLEAKLARLDYLWRTADHYTHVYPEPRAATDALMKALNELYKTANEEHKLARTDYTWKLPAGH